MEDWGREFEEGEGFGARQASQWIQHPWGLTSKFQLDSICCQGWELCSALRTVTWFSRELGFPEKHGLE